MNEDRKYGDIAVALFEKGYNCSQSVFLAFSDMYDMDEETALKISSSFGGGMGRLREVCGAVTGMFMVAGMIYGYADPDDREGKKNHYERIQQLAKEFEKENGNLICRNLLDLEEKRQSPVPEPRTKEYYRKRPCSQLVRNAAEIMAQFIANQNSI